MAPIHPVHTSIQGMQDDVKSWRPLPKSNKNKYLSGNVQIQRTENLEQQRNNLPKDKEKAISSCRVISFLSNAVTEGIPSNQQIRIEFSLHKINRQKETKPKFKQCNCAFTHSILQMILRFLAINPRNSIMRASSQILEHCTLIIRLQVFYTNLYRLNSLS